MATIRPAVHNLRFLTIPIGFRLPFQVPPARLTSNLTLEEKAAAWQVFFKCVGADALRRLGRHGFH